MQEKIKLTPKECLYLDDILSQMYAITQQLNINKECTNEEASYLLEECNRVLETHFEAFKTLLKEASEE